MKKVIRLCALLLLLFVIKCHVVSKIEVFNTGINDWSIVDEVLPGEVAKLSGYLQKGKEIYLLECREDDLKTKVVKVPDGFFVDMGDLAIIMQETEEITVVAELRREDAPFNLCIKTSPEDFGTRIRITHE